MLLLYGLKSPFIMRTQERIEKKRRNGYAGGREKKRGGEKLLCCSDGQLLHWCGPMIILAHTPTATQDVRRKMGWWW